jgi:hypothetical protein
MIGYIIVAIVAFDAGFLAAAILAASGRSDRTQAALRASRPREQQKAAVLS